MFSAFQFLLDLGASGSDMDCQFNHWKKKGLATWVVCGCLAFAASACHHKAKQQQPPNIDSLRDALQRTASVALPTPTLTNRHFIVSVGASALEARAAEIARIAAELNGTVLSNPSSPEGANLLISLPPNRVAEFATRALGETVAPTSDQGSEAPVLVEVSVIAETASPARTP